MSTKLLVKYTDLIKDPLTVKDVMRVNFKPHPYTVGPAHVAHASDHCCGMLGEETCRKIPCAHPGCHTSYEDHVSDHAIILTLTRDCTNKEISSTLKPLEGELKADKIDCFCFVKNKFTIKEN